MKPQEIVENKDIIIKNTRKIIRKAKKENNGIPNERVIIELSSLSTVYALAKEEKRAIEALKKSWLNARIFYGEGPYNEIVSHANYAAGLGTVNTKRAIKNLECAIKKTSKSKLLNKATKKNLRAGLELNLQNIRGFYVAY